MQIRDRSFWPSQGLFWPYCTGCNLGGGQSGVFHTYICVPGIRQQAVSKTIVPVAIPLPTPPPQLSLTDACVLVLVLVCPLRNVMLSTIFSPDRSNRSNLSNAIKWVKPVESIESRKSDQRVESVQPINRADWSNVSNR